MFSLVICSKKRVISVTEINFIKNLIGNIEYQ